MSYLVVGADVSVNHSAIVVGAPDGEVVTVRYLTQKVMDTKASLGGTRVSPMTKKHVSRSGYETERLVWLKNYYDDVLEHIAALAVERGASDIYVALEGFAYNIAAAGKGKAPMMRGKPYQIGEVAGVFKVACKDLGFKLRIHDPTSVKMFATDNGNARKEDVQTAVVELMLQREFDLGIYPRGDVIGDVGDAAVLMEMVRQEVHVRAGMIAMHELEKGPRRVFLRVTKKYPVNLLDRPWE